MGSVSRGAARARGPSPTASPRRTAARGRHGRVERALLAEDCRLLAFRGSASAPEWLTEAEADALLAAKPSADVPADQAQHFLGGLLEELDTLTPAFERAAHDHANELLAAHERVREAVKGKGSRHRVEPRLPVDVLGGYVYLPEGIA